MAKASQEQADLKKAVGKIGVDGKLEDGNQTPNVQGYSFVGAPSPAPGKFEMVYLLSSSTRLLIGQIYIIAQFRSGSAVV